MSYVVHQPVPGTALDLPDPYATLCPRQRASPSDARCDGSFSRLRPQRRSQLDDESSARGETKTVGLTTHVTSQCTRQQAVQRDDSELE